MQPSGRCYSKVNYNCVSFPWFTLINELSTDRGSLISLSSKGSLSLSLIFLWGGLEEVSVVLWQKVACPCLSTFIHITWTRLSLVMKRFNKGNVDI